MAVDLFSTGTIPSVTRLHMRSANNVLAIDDSGDRDPLEDSCERKKIICWRMNE